MNRTIAALAAAGLACTAAQQVTVLERIRGVLASASRRPRVVAAK